MKYTRTLPDFKRVPGEFLNSHGSSEPDDWSYYEDEFTSAIGISYTGVTAGDPASNLPAVKAGILWYVEDGREGSPNLQKGKVFRDRGPVREYFSDDRAQPGPLSNAALALQIPEDSSANPATLPRAIVWRNDGSQSELSAPANLPVNPVFVPPPVPFPDAKAINDASQVVGEIRYAWERNSPTPPARAASAKAAAASVSFGARQRG